MIPLLATLPLAVFAPAQAAANTAAMWYAIPLVVSVSLVCAATRHELMHPIIEHAIRFGVWLGDRDRADDGLVGFFIAGADGEPDFETFYCAVGDEHDALEKPRQDTITVTADRAPAPVVVTMLIDPRCPVHAATGILPVKSLAIPGDLVTRGLAALEYTFLTGPLIVPHEHVGAPAPAAAAGWAWIDRGGDQHAWREHELKPVETGLPPMGRERIVDGWLKLGRRGPDEPQA